MPKQEMNQIMEEFNSAKHELNERLKEFDVPLCQIINKLGITNKNSELLGEKDFYLALNRRLREMEKKFEESLIFDLKEKNEITEESQKKLSNQSLNIFLLRNMITQWFSSVDEQAKFSEKLRKLIDLNNKSKQTENKPNLAIFNTLIDDKISITFKNFGTNDQEQFNGINGYVPGYFEENGEYQEGYYKFYVPQLNEFIKIFESELHNLRVPIVGNKNFADFGNVKYGGNCFFNSLISVMVRRPSFYIFLLKLADRIFKPGDYKFESDFENMFHVLKEDDICKKFKEQCPTLVALADYVKVLDEAEKNKVTYVIPRYLRKRLEDIQPNLFKQVAGNDPTDVFDALFYKFTEEMNSVGDVLSSDFEIENDFMSFDFYTDFLAHHFFFNNGADTFYSLKAEKSYYSASTQINPYLMIYLNQIRNDKLNKPNTNSEKVTLNMTDISCWINSRGSKMGLLIESQDRTWLKNSTGMQLVLDRGSNTKMTFKECDVVLPSLIKNGNNYFMMDGVVTHVPPNHYISIVRDKENTFYEVNDSSVSKVGASVLTKEPVVGNGYFVFYRRITENVFDLEKSYGATFEDLTDPEAIDSEKYFLPLLLHGSYDGMKKFLCDIGLIDEKTNSLLKENKAKSEEPLESKKISDNPDPEPITNQTNQKIETNEQKNDQKINKSKEDIKKDETKDKDKDKGKPKSESKKKIFGGSRGLYIFLCIITLGIFYFFRSAPKVKALPSKKDYENKTQNKDDKENKTNETNEQLLSKFDQQTKPLQKVNSQIKAKYIENNKDDKNKFDKDQCEH